MKLRVYIIYLYMHVVGWRRLGGNGVRASLLMRNEKYVAFRPFIIVTYLVYAL